MSWFMIFHVFTILDRSYWATDAWIRTKEKHTSKLWCSSMVAGVVWKLKLCVQLLTNFLPIRYFKKSWSAVNKIARDEKVKFQFWFKTIASTLQTVYFIHRNRSEVISTYSRWFTVMIVLWLAVLCVCCTLVCWLVVLPKKRVINRSEPAYIMCEACLACLLRLWTYLGLTLSFKLRLSLHETCRGATDSFVIRSDW